MIESVLIMVLTIEISTLFLFEADDAVSSWLLRNSNWNL